MSETTMTAERKMKIHYPGRFNQIIIYLGKLLRGFIYQADWKVMPLAALIAGLASMVVRKDFFLTMEGTLKGALALTSLSIWNGAFNSIQVICRERDILKREHRSGLHISAYIVAHMIYQALLCIIQTVITLFVFTRMGIQFPKQGLFTPWLIVDMGITIFIMSYASDMLSLWISSLVHNTTSAMTIMPFILIFQLIFSGGIFSLPGWASNLATISISNYGMKCLAAQGNYNNLPAASIWNNVVKIENQEISTTITLGQIMDLMQNENIDMVKQIREDKIQIPTMQELLPILGIDGGAPLGEGMPSLNELILYAGSMLDSMPQDETDTENTDYDLSIVKEDLTVGKIIDALAASDDIQASRDKSYTLSTTVSQILDIVGRDKAQAYIESVAMMAGRIPAYENTREKILGYWGSMSLFIIGFACLSVIFLEFIDKDKR